MSVSRVLVPSVGFAVAGLSAMAALRAKKTTFSLSSNNSSRSKKALSTKAADGVVVDAKGVKHAPSDVKYVRECKVNDLELRIMSELVNVAFYEGDGMIWTQGQRFRMSQDGEDARKIAEAADSTLLVYEDPVNNQLEGCVRVDWDIENDVGHFSMVSVPMLYGGRGIGSLLVQAAQLYLKEKLSPKGEIVMDVISIREDLFGFYGRRGFKRIGPVDLPDELKDRACPEFRHVRFELMKKPISEVKP